MAGEARGSAQENRYYAPGAERAGKVHALFARIARRYDLINDLMSWGLHRRWKRRLVELAGARPGDRVLDLCCGTGDVARDVARAISRALAGDPSEARAGARPGPRDLSRDAARTGAGLPEEPDGISVTGLDFTEEMLSVARRLTPEALPVRYRQGDVLALPFGDGEFQLLTVAYGLRNLADLDRGLREAHRVLAPGGRLASLEFGRPRSRILAGLYFAYLRAALPLFGLLFFGDPQTYGYIFATVSRFPGQRELAGRMREAGFDPVEIHDLMGGTMGICVARKPGGTLSPERPGS